MVKRKALPDTRRGRTHSVTIYAAEGDLVLHIRTGNYKRGKVGEVFVSVAKAGSTLNSMFDLLGRLFSYNLQRGASLEEMARKLIDHRFPPAGRTSNAAIPSCLSIPDYVGKWLLQEFIESAAESAT